MYEKPQQKVESEEIGATNSFSLSLLLMFLCSVCLSGSNITHIAEEIVTKQYLYENLNELRSQDSAVSLLAKMVTQPLAQTRRTSSRKGIHNSIQITVFVGG